LGLGREVKLVGCGCAAVDLDFRHYQRGVINGKLKAESRCELSKSVKLSLVAMSIFGVTATSASQIQRPLYPDMQHLLINWSHPLPKPLCPGLPVEP
jgi:hypothetical protein